MIRIIMGILILVLLPVSVLAAPTITCHCFTDRAYDPSRPALADPYFLATTQNSFFAVLFTVDKKKIVIKKQTGSSADDLWVGYWIASKTGVPAETLLDLRGKKGAWKEVLAPMGLPVKSLGERFTAEVTADAPVARLAQMVVDDVLVRYHLLGEQELSVLRKEWATNQEVIITALLVSKSRRSSVGIFREVKKGVKSWGALLNEARIQPSGMQAEFTALLK